MKKYFVTDIIEQFKALRMLLLVALCSSCSLLQKAEPPAQPISREEFAALFQEYGLVPQSRPDVVPTTIPFKTIAEARAYLAELAKVARHEGDGEGLRNLEMTYRSFYEAKNELRFVWLHDKDNSFAGSNYEGYRYALFNPTDLHTEPQILEIVVDKNSRISISEDNTTLPRCLYNSLIHNSKISGGFTGYAFLYTHSYRRIHGKAYLNDQVFTADAKWDIRPDGKASVTTKAPAGANHTGNKANGCVHWIDYYVDGTYITTACLEYQDYGDTTPWGGGSGGGGTGGGGTGGGSGGGGGLPLEDNPDPEAGIGIVMKEYGALPGQNVYALIAYNNGAISTFDSGLTGAEGFSQWVHLAGQQRSFASNEYSFDIAFKVNTITPGGYVVVYGTPHTLFGTYSLTTKTGYISVPKYW